MKMEGLKRPTILTRSANAKEFSRRSRIAESVPGSADLPARGNIVDGLPGRVALRAVALGGIVDLGRLERPRICPRLYLPRAV
jgi:hypothetical protein